MPSVLLLWPVFIARLSLYDSLLFCFFLFALLSIILTSFLSPFYMLTFYSSFSLQFLCACSSSLPSLGHMSSDQFLLSASTACCVIIILFASLVPSYLCNDRAMNAHTFMRITSPIRPSIQSPHRHSHRSIFQAHTKGNELRIVHTNTLYIFFILWVRLSFVSCQVSSL